MWMPGLGQQLARRPVTRTRSVVLFDWPRKAAVTASRAVVESADPDIAAEQRCSLNEAAAAAGERAVTSSASRPAGLGIRPGWVKARLVGSEDTEPNARGHKTIKSAPRSTVFDRPTTLGPVRLRRRAGPWARNGWADVAPGSRIRPHSRAVAVEVEHHRNEFPISKLIRAAARGLRSRSAGKPSEQQNALLADGVDDVTDLSLCSSR